MPLFTDAEDRLIEQWYPRYGPSTTARKLGHRFTPEQIRRRAVYRGYRWGVTPGSRLVSEVAADAGVCIEAVRKAALRAGVATVLTSGKKHRCLVPERWAREYIVDRKRRADATGLQGHYYTLAETAAVLGVSERHVDAWLYTRRRGEGDAFRARVRSVQAKRNGHGPGGGWLFNPHDVEAFRRERDLSDYIDTVEAAAILGLTKWQIRTWVDGKRVREPASLMPAHVRMKWRGRNRWLHRGDVYAFRGLLDHAMAQAAD